MDDTSTHGGGPDPPVSAETVLRDFAPHPYQSLNEEGEIITVNEAWEDLLGYARAEVVNEWFGTFLTAESTARFDSQFPEFKACGTVSEVELELLHSDGHSLTVTLDGRIEYDDDGTVLRSHCQLNDISERKERNRELIELEETVETIFSNVPLVVFAFDDRGVFTRSQGHALERLGFDPGEAVGQSVFDLFDDRPDILDHCERALDGEQVTATVEIRGTVFESWYQPVRENGEVVGVVGHSYDITERIAQQRELERSQDLLRHTETLARTGGWEADIDTGEQRWTDGTYAIHDLSTAEFDPTVETGVEFYHPADQDRIERVVRRCMEDGEPYDEELRLITAEDRLRWVRATGEAVYEDGEISKIRGAIRDITERKERERALERYERLVENLPIGIYRNTPEPEEEFVLVNDAMVEMFDADSKEQLLNRPPSDLYLDPDEHAAFGERLAVQGVIQSEEVRLETFDGRTIWGEITAIATASGGETVVDGAIQNVTERKEYEQRLMEQRDNLDLLNQVLRHDIRNDLQLVTAYADFLSDHVDDEGKSREYVEQVVENAEHAVELTMTARDMADVMLTTVDDRHQMPLRSSLEGELDEIRSTYPEAIITLDGSVPPVTVIANDMLASVFRNLLKNAVQHNDKEMAEVTVSATEGDGTVAVRIADNGPGVPDDQKEVIFGKGEKGLDSHGTGIGLYLVRTLVETYGGDVWVEDNESEGAVFTVELPKAA
jgi:PAS domain S-box-containing protein